VVLAMIRRDITLNVTSGESLIDPESGPRFTLWRRASPLAINRAQLSGRGF
jgi:hypothetical protein